MRQPIIAILLRFSQKHAVTIIIVTFLLTIALGFFAVQVEINPDIENLIPEDEKITQLMKKYSNDEESTDHLILAAESDDPFTMEKLNALATAISRIEKLPDIRSVINPFNVITFRKEGKKLEIVPLAVGNKAPQNAQELSEFISSLKNDPFASKLVLSEDGTMLAAIFATGIMEDHAAFISSYNNIISDLEEHYRIYSTSLIHSTNRAKAYLLSDLPKLLGFTALFILVMYYFGFKAKRAIILPLIVVSFGAIWCVGFMKLLGYPISVVSISTPPLVLVLGSSYSIHMLNQYYREIESVPTNNIWIVDAVAHVNRTILMAAATTVIGFSSLLATTIKQTRQFGVSTSIGIIVCALLSLFFLPAALSRLKTPTSVQRKKVREGSITKFMAGMGPFVLRWRIPTMAFLILITLVFAITLPHIQHQSDYIAYFPNREKIVKDFYYITEKLGGFQQINLTLTAPEGQKNYFLDRAVLKRISDFENRLAGHSNVYQVISFVSYLKYLNQVMTGENEIPDTRGLILLLSRYIKTLAKRSEEIGESVLRLMADEDFSRLTISFRVYDSERMRYLYEERLRTLMAAVQTDIEETLDPDTEPELWGTSLRYLSLAELVNRNQAISMIISVVLIFLVTSISFRSVAYGFLSLIPLATGVMLSFIFMVIFVIPLDITTVIVSCVTIGVGVDNSIHFLIQYRKQIALFPGNISDALSHTLAISGRPILLTTTSIVGGLLILTLASFKPIIYFGLLVAFSLFATAVGTLVILPAVLSLFRRPCRNGIGEVKDVS